MYSFDRFLALITFVLWNFYVITLQFCWDRVGERHPESNQENVDNNSFKKEESEFQYFDKQCEVEFSKHENSSKDDDKKSTSFGNLVLDGGVFSKFGNQETVENMELNKQNDFDDSVRVNDRKEKKKETRSDGNPEEENQNDTFNGEFEVNAHTYQPFEDEENGKDDQKFV